MWPFSRKRRISALEEMKPSLDFYVRVRNDVLCRLEGRPADGSLETENLSKQGFTTVHFMHVLVEVARKYGVPYDKVAEFLRVGDPPDHRSANLFLRAATMVGNGQEAGDLSVEQSIVLLQAGVVGRPDEVGPLRKDFDNLSFVTRMAAVIKELDENWP